MAKLNITISPTLKDLPHFPLADLVEFQGELKDLDNKRYNRLKKSIKDKGLFIPFFVWQCEADNTIYILDGHQRKRVLSKEGFTGNVPCVVIEADNEKDAKERLLVISSQYGKITQEGFDAFTYDLDPLFIQETTFFDGLPFVYGDFDIAPLEEPEEEEEPQDSEPQIDKAKELAEKWGVQPGQLWILPSRDGKGEHRLLCGDSTKEGDVKLVNLTCATLLHADPPYGMGKEKDGVQNDNLYNDKLDSFQLSWLKASLSSLTDNASVYIWGNAEDLWRLWYKKILTDFPRVTFRNELVWDKKHGQGMGSESHRMYPTASERCLFFMLGEQGFNNNADNYWEGWDSVRLYLESQKKLMGWSNKTIANFFGFHPRMADHWFSNSQWSFPLEEQYRTMQREANGKAFKKEYDELKKEYDELKQQFYSTRAYFDNTHQNMTDVFFFERVTGEERHDHATPKPTAMIQMLIKSSCPIGGAVFEPFLGSGTTLIACENTGRYCRAIEISPGYVAVALQRYLDTFGIEAICQTTNQNQTNQS